MSPAVGSTVTASRCHSLTALGDDGVDGIVLLWCVERDEPLPLGLTTSVRFAPGVLSIRIVIPGVIVSAVATTYHKTRKSALSRPLPKA